MDWMVERGNKICFSFVICEMSVRQSRGSLVGDKIHGFNDWKKGQVYREKLESHYNMDDI